jgi:hypothetical protein
MSIDRDQEARCSTAIIGRRKRAVNWTKESLTHVLAASYIQQAVNGDARRRMIAPLRGMEYLRTL